MRKDMAIKEKIEYLNIMVELTERLDNMYKCTEEERQDYMLKLQETKEEWYEEMIRSIDTKLNAIEELKEDLEVLAE